MTASLGWGRSFFALILRHYPRMTIGVVAILLYFSAVLDINPQTESHLTFSLPPVKGRVGNRYPGKLVKFL